MTLLSVAHAAGLMGWNHILAAALVEFACQSGFTGAVSPHGSTGYYPSEEICMVALPLQQPSAWVVDPWFQEAPSFEI